MVNLNQFLQGKGLNENTVKEEMGFYRQGNIQAIINSPNALLNSISNGILINTVNETRGDDILSQKRADINMMSQSGLWSMVTKEQPTTPIVSNTQRMSELLPHYPTTVNGQKVPNMVLNSDCNFQINGVAAPQLYGVSTFGANDSNILTDSCNHIGYELDARGVANRYGTRALSQKDYAKEELRAGWLVPNLYTTHNHNGLYYTKPGTFKHRVPLYQTGDWTDAKIAGPNFLTDFHNSLKCDQ